MNEFYKIVLTSISIGLKKITQKIYSVKTRCFCILYFSRIRKLVLKKNSEKYAILYLIFLLYFKLKNERQNQCKKCIKNISIYQKTMKLIF